MPAAVRSKALQPLAARVPSAQRCHVGLDPRFIDEHQAPRIEMGHGPQPAPATPDNVEAVLLTGVRGFF